MPGENLGNRGSWWEIQFLSAVAPPPQPPGRLSGASLVSIRWSLEATAQTPGTSTCFSPPPAEPRPHYATPLQGRQMSVASGALDFHVPAITLRCAWCAWRSQCAVPPAAPGSMGADKRSNDVLRWDYRDLFPQTEAGLGWGRAPKRFQGRSEGTVPPPGCAPGHAPPPPATLPP